MIRRQGKVTENPHLKTAKVFVIREGRDAGKLMKERETWFRVSKEPGQVFRFFCHRRHDKGGEWVSAFGGDKDPNATRHWRSFAADAEFVIVPPPPKERN